ncbi:hypothetical protein Dform_00698 [Dehalogenimonas formicexedens]|uniref:Uncharacterized protein n=1 Tax=Dehalogenimonas formicexedens TaxID=1839801 RepID=A0A1P8F6F9_9CHLR|nr:YkgJ family cysteine cluster protein [Dehalogenimonas formicexedens]APV44053.1 hypothetical protein Dform_00698 [Dehalogenimonas formicexedens]
MAKVFENLGIADTDLSEARKIVTRHLNSDFGEKYERYIATVGAALLKVYPPARNFSPSELVDIVSITDIIGPESRAIMKRMKEACTGCGWCCSQTRRIVVDEADTIRISRKLKRKREDIFALDGKDWVIKQAHPCGWWNPKNGRCQIYGERPRTCRVWPLGINELNQQTVQAVAQCNYAVMVLANKVIWMLQSAEKAAGAQVQPG